VLDEATLPQESPCAGAVQPRANAVDEDEAETPAENDEPRPKTLGAGRFKRQA
jgi:hypothetical protein